MTEARLQPGGDGWIPTICSMCYNQCGVRVHRVNGVVVKVEGNPDTPYGMGRLCGKGVAAIMTLYDPHRLKKPLKRTNPQKGIGVDPQWEEITWDKALNIMVNKLSAIRKDDPRKLIIASSVAIPDGIRLDWQFGVAFGTCNRYISGASTHCGAGEHLLGYLKHASWNKFADYEHCNYLLLFGCNAGFSAYYSPTSMAQKCADARRRGMKLVVVDPICNTSAEKADEWVPIRVGTDAALALAMINVLLNELGVFDAAYLKHHTNAPYLVGEDGLYIRDKGSSLPLVWDNDSPKPYNDPTIEDFALEGRYQVDGQTCQPAFSRLKEHVRAYTPEEAAKITTVPAATIRRLAQEFGQAAQIGSKIFIQGEELPLRPAAVLYFSGAQGHKHSFLTSAALELLNAVVGACDVPGGVLGANALCLGHPTTGLPTYGPKEGPDGLMVADGWRGMRKPFPPGRASPPESFDLSELFPVGIGSSLPTVVTVADPQGWKIPYEAEAMIIVASNVLMSLGNPETVAEAFARIPFIVSFNLNLNETADALADLVLPDACFLEKLDIMHNRLLNSRLPTGEGEWALLVKQPVVPPPEGVRDVNEVVLELAERLGISGELNAVLNVWLRLRPPYTLDVNKRYTLAEIFDVYYRCLFGNEHSLEWFKEHGCIKWPKRLREVYWRPFIPVRTPIYFEHFISVGNEVREVTQRLGLEWDTVDYQALPDWRPCLAHEIKKDGFDFYAFYYKVAWHTFSWTQQNPWLDEVARQEAWSYRVLLNERVAQERGIKEGDPIWVESTEGFKVKGIATLSQAVHPEALAIAGNGGHWAPGLPGALGKGALGATLHPTNFQYMDFVSGNQDLCAKARVYKDKG